MEMLKRDFEEPIFIDPQQSDSESEYPIFYLPRTDRKQNLFPLNYFDANNQMFQMSENPFENLQIDLRSIPSMKHTEEVDERQRQQPPSQKEFLGPIVVGPQTKSTQTSSLKKA
uniref:Uncharacterized protein n=1 Tax=Panagrolaimus davidi TaxID=227884 RepID=A0A914QEY4_9BILA